MKRHSLKPKFRIYFYDAGAVWNAIPVNMEAVIWWNQNHCINQKMELNGAVVYDDSLSVRLKDKR